MRLVSSSFAKVQKWVFIYFSSMDALHIQAGKMFMKFVHIIPFFYDMVSVSSSRSSNEREPPFFEKE